MTRDHKPTELPFKEIEMVTKPIQVPTRRRQGAIIQVLDATLKLEPTTIETGLAPHFEWPCKHPKDLRNKMASLQSARRRLSEQDKKYRKVSFMQRANPEQNEFRVYIWLQE